MGLEFQSRAFLRLHESDHFVPEWNDGWAVTGRERNFYHFCQEGKGSSFDAARAAFAQSSSLQRSLGFFSIQEDYLDCYKRTRAYVLERGMLREIDTKSVWSETAIATGLYQHFDWCRQCIWPDKELSFPPFSRRLEEKDFAQRAVDVAGWFFIPKEHRDFPSLLHIFPRPEIAAIAQSASWNDHYLFVGESSIPLREVMPWILKASENYPQGKGLLLLPEGRSIRQIAIAEGQAQLLLPLELNELPYHADVKFTTGRFGYEER